MIFHSNSILKRLKKIVTENPDQKAISSNHKKGLSYGELYEKIFFLQKQIETIISSTNDRVGLLITNQAVQFILSIAISERAICVPIENNITQSELDKKIAQMEVSIIISDFANIKIKSSKVRCVSLSSSPTDLDIILETKKVNLPNLKPLKSNRTSFLLQTTGTTSLPKTVPIRQESIYIASNAMIKHLGITKNDKCLNFSPMNFIHGFITCGFVPLLAGSEIQFVGSFNILDFKRWLQNLKPTWFSASPTIYHEIIKLPPLNNKEKQGLRFLRVGSAPCSLDLSKKIEQYFNLPLIEAYGMTETLVISCNNKTHKKENSVGQIIGGKVKIVNEKGEKCKSNTVGEILFKSKQVFNGYLGSKNHFRGKWFSTGDLGYIDKDGFLYIVGRIKELINKGGVKINPLELELELKKHPLIEEAVVFSIPHESLGESIGAAIQSKKNEPITDTEIKEFLLKYIAQQKIPSKFFSIHEFEKNANGKILRNKVKDYVLNKKISSLHTDLKPQEVWVKSIFEKVLNKTLSTEIDFFINGGTSIDAVELISEFEKQLNIKLDGVNLMINSNVTDFSTFLSTYHEEKLKKHLQNIGIQFHEANKIETELNLSSMIEMQKKLLKSWEGIKEKITNLIIGKNTSGTKPPLFWCFQDYPAFNKLANYLGKDQPVYAMRSGHLIFNMSDAKMISYLAKVYCSDILSIAKENAPLFIGGNCQGARVAWEINKILQQKNIQITKLFIMELNMKERYNQPLQLIYGSKSKTHNPLLYEENAIEEWNKYYSNYSYELLEGEHGTYFKPETIHQLGNVIKKGLC